MGWLGTVCQGVILSQGSFPEVERLIPAGIFLGTAVLGYAMLVAFELLAVGKDYRVAARRLLPCLALELALQLLIALALASVIGGIRNAFEGRVAIAVSLESFFIASAVSATWLFNHLKISRALWEQEALTGECPVD